MQLKFGSVSICVSLTLRFWLFCSRFRLFCLALLSISIQCALSIRNVVRLQSKLTCSSCATPPMPSAPLPPPVKCWPLMAKTVNRQPYEMACQVPTKAELLFILTFCRAWPNARMAPTLLALP